MTDTTTPAASTAVAPLPTPTDNALEEIRTRGATEVAHRREVAKIVRQLDGTEWGALSPSAQGAFAEFCKITRANPMLHVDKLGNRPYLNSNYWEDLANSNPLFVRYEQRDLSPSVEQAHRDLAAKQLAAAADLPEGAEKTARVERALASEDTADAIAIARAQWSPRPTATAVIETTVFRYQNAALPLLQAGSYKPEDLVGFIVEVRECNWAGGMLKTMADQKKFDPIGDANPGTTARTRSLRRTLVKTFSAWMAEYERKIEKAEEYLEAEFEVIGTHEGPAGHTLEIAEGEIVQTATSVDELPTTGNEPETALEPEDDFDYDDARKKMMATWRDAGLSKKRKQWSKDNGFPESIKEWTPDQYRSAYTLLVGPVIEEVRALVDSEEELEDVSLKVLEKNKPEYLKDWNAVLAVLQAREPNDDDDDEEGDDAQAPLGDL